MVLTTFFYGKSSYYFTTYIVISGVPSNSLPTDEDRGHRLMQIIRRGMGSC